MTGGVSEHGVVRSYPCDDFVSSPQLRDAIVKITSTAICGSDLHLLDGYVPTMQKGDIMGHEFMGEVIEVGPGVDREKRYMKPLLERIRRGELDPTRVITHRLPLGQAPHGYDIFKHKQDNCEKVVLTP